MSVFELHTLHGSETRLYVKHGSATLCSVFSQVLFDCACCGDKATGRPVASCASCEGGLCPGCLGRHAAGRGIFKAHAFAPATPGAEELTALGLHPSAQLCEAHPFEALTLACTTCDLQASGSSPPRLICSLCVPDHSGHTVVPMSTLAMASRVCVAKLLYDLPAQAARGAPASEATPDTEVAPLAADLQPRSVEAAREIAQSIAARLASIPGFGEAALSHVSDVRDALISAISDRAMQISEEIRKVVAAKQAAIGDELAFADAELSRVTSESAIVKRALDCGGLSDADIIAHAESLAADVRSTAVVVAALKARPVTSPLLEMRPVGEVFMKPALAARGGLEAHVEAAVKAFGELFVA